MALNNNSLFLMILWGKKWAELSRVVLVPQLPLGSFTWLHSASDGAERTPPCDARAQPLGLSLFPCAWRRPPPAFRLRIGPSRAAVKFQPYSESEGRRRRVPQLQDREVERKNSLLLSLLAIHAFDRLDRPTHTREGNLLYSVYCLKC